MPESLEELLNLDDFSLDCWMRVLFKPKEFQTPAEQQWAYKIQRDHLQLLQHPTGMLSPKLQEWQRKMLSVLSSIENGQDVPAGLEHLSGIENPWQALLQANHLIDFLETCPSIKTVQQQIHTVLDNNNEGVLFDTPALLDAISLHLGRPRRFDRVQKLTPTTSELIDLLEDLHFRKPLTHQAVVQFLVRASLDQQAPHPKRCDCPLCAHIASAVEAFTTVSPQDDVFIVGPTARDAGEWRHGDPVCRCCHTRPG